MHAMNAQKRLLGEEHPNTLTSMNNLALTYHHQGRWDEAEFLLVQTAHSLRRKFGDDHPMTLEVQVRLEWSTYKKLSNIMTARCLYALLFGFIICMSCTHVALYLLFLFPVIIGHLAIVLISR
jgi:hypothetical protein